MCEYCEKFKDNKFKLLMETDALMRYSLLMANTAEYFGD